jgi:Sec7-like guanine-nucleotide exchange factor
LDSPDPFYVEALRSYINQFNFLGIPLDIALRKLLMEVGLPRETQQIDRVIEAFAFRYTQCNPDFFLSEGRTFSHPLFFFFLFIIQNSFIDHAYVLAFSLIMLHTDAFNPSNKRKMTREDYTKNTRLPGVPKEVLDVSYSFTTT